MNILDRKTFLSDIYELNENLYNQKMIGKFETPFHINESFMGIEDKMIEEVAEKLVREGLEKVADQMKQTIQDSFCEAGGAGGTAEFCGVGGVVGGILSKVASLLGDIVCDVDCTNTYKISRVSKGSKEGEYKVNNIDNGQPLIIRMIGGLVTFGFLTFDDTPFNKQFFDHLKKDKDKFLKDAFTKEIKPDMNDLIEHGMEYIKELNTNVYLGCSFEKVFYPLACIQFYTEKDKKIDIGSNSKLNCEVVEVEAKDITIDTIIDKIVEVTKKVFQSLLDIFCGISEVFKDFIDKARTADGKNKENSDEYDKLTKELVEELAKEGLKLVKDMLK